MRIVVTAVLLIGASCSSSELESCKVVCATDADCPGDQTCGDLGRCSAGEACPCQADEFLGCYPDGQAAAYCNATGDGVASESCEGGCNVEESRCNLCTPDALTCGPSGSVATCGADGLPATVMGCDIACVSTEDSARCGYIQPQFLPDICDTPATTELIISTASTFDTAIDSNCNGGVIAQATGPAVCVVRHGRIEVAATLTVVGARPLALVADSELIVSGGIIASAVGGVSGGGAFGVSGLRPATNVGGGGAGFRQIGGAGAGSTGGPALEISPTVTGFRGGPRPEPGAPGAVAYTNGFPQSGGGGGAINLIACRGPVTIGGVISVNGGGGGAGVYTARVTTPQNQFAVGGAGGGAGGVVIVEGTSISVTGRLYANGGAGGGGCVSAGCVPSRGADGNNSAVAATGGNGGEFGGLGGAGGTNLNPTAGFGTSGGGGAAGYLRFYAPAGATVNLIPAEASPVLEPGTLLTR